MVAGEWTVAMARLSNEEIRRPGSSDPKEIEDEDEDDWGGESTPKVKKFAPRRGRSNQPRVSTLGTDHPERGALKGRQIEPPN